MNYVLLIDGDYWQLRGDGVLVKLTEEQYQDLAQVPDNLVLVQGDLSTDSASQYNFSSQSSLAVFFAGLSRISPSLLPESGYRTEQVRSLFENIEQRPLSDNNLPPPIPDDAEISVFIEDNGDGFVNMFEISLVDIFGQTLNIFDRQPVVINLRDSEGRELEFITTLSDSKFSIADADLSSLAQGSLTVTATATDLYGNSIAAIDETVIDTLAIITDDVDLNSGLVVNAAEVSNVDISGSTSEINIGQEIQIVISDTNGAEIAVSTTIDSDGSYEVTGLDFSSFAEGAITITSTSSDVPGNLATLVTNIDKDTIAAIDIVFDGEQPYQIRDLLALTLSGTVDNIEPGQQITVTVTDSVETVSVVTTVLADGTWQTPALNLLTFNNGPLEATATTSDLAGNPATDSDQAVLYVLPPTAAISVTVDDNGDGFINMFEVDAVDIVGTTTDIVDRMPILVTLEDSLGVQVSRIVQAVNGVFTLVDQDLSALAQGPITVTAGARDFYGNSVSATDNSVIDTLATINDDVSFNSGGVVNAAEAGDVDVSGTTAEIDPNQPINIIFRDQNDDVVAAQTMLNADGSYNINDVNLSTLVDGDISVSLASTDVPGNVAARVTTINKDTVAAIDVVFDGALPYGADEVATVTISGTVVGIEPLQTVTVVITDSASPAPNSITTSATVLADLTWQTSVQDLSSFDDGVLSVNVSAVDLAGNPAVDTATTAIDTIATIDIITDPLVDPSAQPLDINALRQGDSVTVQGSVGSVEQGRPVALRFYDTAGNEQIFTTAVQADGSWSAVVAITALNAFSSWNLQASVADDAGNTAFDDTPSLDVPTLVKLPEAALVSNPSFSDDTTIRIVGYDQLALNPMQSALEALESLGVPLTVTVAGDGQSLTAMAGAVLVLDAVLNGDDTATVTLYAPITQPTGSDAVFSSIALLATQVDTDLTTETVAVNIPITIRENIDFTVDDSYNAVEQVLTSGNLFDNDVLLEGPLTIIQVEVAGVLYDVSALAPTVIANADTKGSLTVSSDGNWSFIADRNLDNTVLQQMSFSYSALDQDNDFDSSDVVITIADGAGAVFANRSFALAESDYDQPLSVDQAFVIKAGSDDLDPSLIRFSSELTNLFDALGYKSTGDAISYVLSNGGKTITATVAGGDVFELVLSATLDAATGNLNATVSLTQELPIDHQSSDGDDLSFPIVIEAEDNDGTISSSQATLILEDGNNPTTTAVDGAVTEDSLSSAAVFTGDLTVEIGSDTVVDIGFDSAASSFPNITSGGASLTYTVSADGLLLTASTIAANPIDAVDVFTIEIDAEPTADADSTLQYTFTLLQGLDQLDANGNSVDPLDLSFKYGVTDFDGDEVFSFINVSVSDASGGGSGGGGPTVDIQLTETPKKLANLSVSNEGSVNFSLTASEDPIVDARFDVSNGDVVVDKFGVAITQNDSPLTWASADDNVIQIRAINGTVVAEFTLPEIFSIAPGVSADVPLNISFFQQIDHPQGGPDNITIALDVSFIDSDLTEITLTTEVSVFDGLNPVAIFVQPLAVDEGDIAAVAADDQGLSFGRAGSDTLVGVNFTLNTALKSNGVDVVLAATANADGWWIGSAAGVEVFRVKIDVSGNSEFILSGPLDHIDANGENNLPIDFSVSAIDGDDDESNIITMTVNVTDDVPVDSNRNIKLTEGVNKNINVLKNGEAGADGGEITKVSYDDGTGVTE